MPLSFFSDVKSRILPFPVGWKYAQKNGPGALGSLLFHGLVLLLVIIWATQRTSQSPPAAMHFVPVDLIRLGEETTSPDAAQKSVIPQQRASRAAQASNPTPPEGVAPSKTKPEPLDDLDAKLRALAKLRQPDTKLQLSDSPGVSNVDAGNGVLGDRALYSVRDYVLAQVLRRWSLNLSKAGGRKLVIPIRVAMKRDGTIVSAEIVEEARAKNDALYRDIAISARNAVTLSSPIALPPGDYAAVMHFTLNLDPRATQR